MYVKRKNSFSYNGPKKISRVLENVKNGLKNMSWRFWERELTRKKGCCDCCTNDFEISASEYFMLLSYMDIKFGKDFIQTVSRKARISFSSPNCIFVNNTDGACTVYEARPLICKGQRKMATLGVCVCYTQNCQNFTKKSEI